MTELRFVTGEPVLLVGDALVVSELHIGLETDIYHEGVFLRSSTEKMTKRLVNLVKETKAKKIYIIGDLKHNYVMISGQERREVPMLLEKLAEHAEVHVVPGNHDGLIKELIPSGVKLHKQSGVRVGDAYLCHGHAWPSASVVKAQTLVMAHLHPAVEFRDKLGFRSVEYCWLRARANKKAMAEHFDVEEKNVQTEEVIVVPPFNTLTGGMPVNRPIDEKEISPLTRNKIIDVSESDVYLLDGTHMGVAKKIRQSKRSTT